MMDSSACSQLPRTLVPGILASPSPGLASDGSPDVRTASGNHSAAASPAAPRPGHAVDCSSALASPFAVEAESSWPAGPGTLMHMPAPQDASASPMMAQGSDVAGAPRQQYPPGAAVVSVAPAKCVAGHSESDAPGSNAMMINVAAHEVQASTIGGAPPSDAGSTAVGTSSAELASSTRALGTASSDDCPVSSTVGARASFGNYGFGRVPLRGSGESGGVGGAALSSITDVSSSGLSQLSGENFGSASGVGALRLSESSCLVGGAAAAEAGTAVRASASVRAGGAGAGEGCPPLPLPHADAVAHCARSSGDRSGMEEPEESAIAMTTQNESSFLQNPLSIARLESEVLGVCGLAPSCRIC